jgi:ligand-binding SRPBCC domain-containing protein
MMYQFKRIQFVKTDLQTCWDFFSSPDNLAKITPKYMGFDVKTSVPKQMYEGLIIAYTVKPVLGIPVEWVTEITHIKDKAFFVDEQRKGPYTLWHHEHHFRELDGGVEMTDIVSYIIPFGMIGRIIHPFLVKPKLKEIFEYRFKAVDELFK